jgi:hypothetical protein
VIPLDVALRFLPLTARERGDQGDGWPLRWLVRWITETQNTTIARAAEVACSLADARQTARARLIRRRLSYLPPPVGIEPRTVPRWLAKAPGDAPSLGLALASRG